MKRLLLVLCFLPLLLLGGCGTTSTAYNDRGWFDPMRRSLNNKSYGYQIVEDVTGSAPTKFIERFEVRPGDCSANAGGWDDCATNRERSELTQVNMDILIGSTEWYGWYIFVPMKHNVISPPAYMGQFHQYHAQPAWMFITNAGGYYLDRHLRSRKYLKLIDKTDLLGKWNKIEINAKWSKSGDGFFRVYVNGKISANFRGKTASASQIYFKYGVYRTHVSSHKANYNTEALTQIVYFTKVKRGGSREDIQ